MGSIQTTGTTPGVMGFWDSNNVLHFGQGAGDVPGTPVSDLAQLDTGGNLSVGGGLVSTAAIKVGASVGVTCSGTPIEASPRFGGIVTHC